MTSNTAPVWRPSNARAVVVDGFVPVPRGSSAVLPAVLTWPTKDPADILDYTFDIGPALAGNSGDRLVSVSVQVNPTDLVVGSVVVDGSVAVMWLSGGSAGTLYTVTVSAGTANGRTLARAVQLPVQSLSTAISSVNALLSDTGAPITDASGNPILLGS